MISFWNLGEIIDFLCLISWAYPCFRYILRLYHNHGFSGIHIEWDMTWWIMGEIVFFFLCFISWPYPCFKIYSSSIIIIEFRIFTWNEIWHDGLIYCNIQMFHIDPNLVQGLLLLDLIRCRAFYFNFVNRIHSNLMCNLVIQTVQFAYRQTSIISRALVYCWSLKM